MGFTRKLSDCSFCVVEPFSYKTAPSRSDTHLCSRKLIRKFIRFLRNPLPLLQTPQNLLGTMKNGSFTLLYRISLIIFQAYKYYTPTQRRESSSHELCPTEYWGSVGDSRTPRELCSHRLGRRSKNLPVFSQPGRRYAASYKRRVD